MSAAAGMPQVAIVGYPNVGKSTLVNRLAGGREYQPKQHPQCCRLAGTVRSEESIHVAGAYVEIHCVDGP